MIILDTSVLIFNALAPEKLSAKAKKALEKGEKDQQLFCCDISLWEIAMLIEKKRIDPGIVAYNAQKKIDDPYMDIQSFLHLVLMLRNIQLLRINPEIAASTTTFKHIDPADRLIAATTIHYAASLVTCDQKLRDIPNLSVVW